MKQIRHKLLTRGLPLLLAGALAGSCSVEEKAVTGVRFSIGGVSSQESETRSAAIDSLASQNDSIAPVILALGDGIALECELREEAESLLKATTTAFSNGHKFRIISTRGSAVEDKGEFAAGSGDIHLTGLTSGTYTFSTYSYNNTSSLPSPSSNLIDNISPNQDLLYWHSGNINISANSSTSCNIVFKHLFPQVQVVVNAKDKNSSNGLIISALSAKLTPGKYARMDVTDGSLSAGTSGDFQQSLTWNNMNTSSLTSDFRSVYTNTAGAVNLVFDMASVTVDGTAYTGKTVTFNNVTLTPGKRYTMTVNINKDNAGAISSLGCSSVAGVTATQGTVVSVIRNLPYSGKTGSDIILPSGQSLGTANGLTVSANGAQTLSAASGNISIQISGTPTTSGTVNIPIAVGGTSCSVSVSVAQQPGEIGTLYYSSVTWVYVTTLTTVTVIKDLPYSKIGGNISLTNGQLLGSKYGLSVRVNGAHTLSASSGTISIIITGKATTIGAMTIPITVGTKSCSLNVTGVKCGAFIAQGVWKKFMCHNLGADESLDPFTPAAGLHGHKYRWGTKNASYVMVLDQSNSGIINNWTNICTGNFPCQTTADDWEPSNNPCPAGWRVPTNQEWLSVANTGLNTQTRIGSVWSGMETNYTSGLKLGTALFLPAAGYRDVLYGRLGWRGGKGLYWSSTARGLGEGWNLCFNSGGAMNYDSNVRTLAVALRCIKE